MIKSICIETPLGSMLACAFDEGVCILEFIDDHSIENILVMHAKRFKSEIIPAVNSHLNLLRTQLDEYFAGKRVDFSVPLFTSGTSFQQRVWAELLKIPYGVTRSYKEQAIALNKPEAIRAVAGSNGCNPVAIIIPCHRIIGENGKLTGYSGRLWRKKWLLDFERKDQTKLNF